MALFTDGPISTTEDLRAYESSILEVAHSEGIDLTIKLAIAKREVGLMLMKFLSDESGASAPLGGYEIEQVVVNDGVRQWHSLHTLSLSFRDAHHNQINDRYEKKWRAYEEQSRLSRELLYATGVGIATTVVPGGTAPQVSAISGVVPSGMYQFATTWVNAQGQEGAASPPAPFRSQNGDAAVLAHGAAPAVVTGWHVYGALEGQPLQRQTTTPVAIGSTWTMGPDGIQPGTAAPDGQEPNIVLRKTRVHLRG